MKLTKKLTALFLTLAMALSLCVCVNASDLTALPSAEQKSESEITSEVSPTSTVYKLVFPTAADNVFDFILDPNNLIRNTHAAAYSGATFSDTAGHLFFKNTDATDDDPATYSGSSNSVTVTNKSNVPVNVTLTTSLTGLSADDYTFSATDDLSSADGPAIYLAMESECVDSDEAEWDYTLPEVTYVNDDYIGIIDTVVFAWDDVITAAVEAAADADATDDEITAGTAANALKDAFNTALAEGLKIEIDYEHGEDGATMTATPKAVTLDGYTLTFDESAYPLNPEVEEGAEDAAVVAALTVAENKDASPATIGTFTFTFKADLDTDTDYLEDATVSVSVAAGSQVINEATPVAADDSAVKAEVTRLLPGVPNAYELTYDDTDKAYVYAEKEDHGIPYKSFSFNLTGKINDDDGWSSITGTPKIAVTWNMTAVGAEEEGDGDGNEPETPQVTPPTLTVTTGITSNTASGVWTINVGTSGMTKVASAKVGTKTLTVATGTSGTAGKATYKYDASAGTITVYNKASTTYTMALFKTATITLADNDGNQYTLASFDGATVNGEFTLTAVGE